MVFHILGFFPLFKTFGWQIRLGMNLHYYNAKGKKIVKGRGFGWGEGGGGGCYVNVLTIVIY